MANRANNILLVFCLLLTLGSCKKSPFTNGDIVTEERALPSHVNTIDIHDDISVVLVHSDTPRLQVKTGSNLIDGITTTIKDSTLILRNKNTFNWLRPYDCPFEVTVFYNQLGIINYESIGTVTAKDSIQGIMQCYLDTIIQIDSTLVIDTTFVHDTIPVIDTTFLVDTSMTITSNNQDVFKLNINGGAGDINLLLKCRMLQIDYQEGTSKVTLQGESILNYIFMRSYGPVVADSLRAHIVDVTNKSPNNCHVWATESLSAKITGKGNVYYRGDPFNIKCVTHGDGRLIKQP